MSPAFRRWSFPLSFLSLAWLGFVQAGTAQLGNSAQIDRDYIAIKGKLSELFSSGGKDKVIPNDVLDVAAKYWVYRVTWPGVLDGKPDAEPASHMHVRYFIDHMNKVALSKATDPSFAKAYGPVLVARFKELTDLPVVDNARALVYGVHMLPALAKLQQPEIGKYLVELLDPKAGKHDVIKLGAIKGLREFMPVDPWGDAKTNDVSLLADKIKMARKAADLERIDVLTQFILRPLPNMAKPEEIEAFRYLRREAIETLARAEAPAVAAVTFVNKIDEVAGPIAPVLLRVLIPGAISPEAPETNLYEQNEAALGLCHMKLLDKYEPAPIYYFVNKTFFDLAHDYSVDFVNVAAGEKRAVPTKFPWKITSKRWESAFKQLVANAPSADKEKAKKLDSDARPVLKAMFDHKSINANVVAPNPTTAPLAEFLLFKSIKSAPLKWEGAK